MFTNVSGMEREMSRRCYFSSLVAAYVLRATKLIFFFLFQCRQLNLALAARYSPTKWKHITNLFIDKVQKNDFILFYYII